MPKYIKPSGAEIEVNAGSEEHAKSLGWVLAEEKTKPKPKRKRRTKAEMESAK